MRVARARPRHNARIYLDGLTASELRTARLVAEGRSNAEAAQALFVSLKTIETHLSDVYAKLSLAGAGARHQLADTLADQVPLPDREILRVLP
jgi:DNA-binding CsgD family transcriptional regulator